MSGNSVKEPPGTLTHRLGNPRQATEAQWVSTFSSMKWVHHFVTLKGPMFCKL